MKIKSTVIAAFTLALFSSMSQAAVDCEKLFATMPDHSNDKSDVAKQLQTAGEACEKKFPTQGKENKQNDACLNDSFTELANKGNYLAAVEIAANACQAGNTADAKKWLTAVVNNAKAPKDEKDKAAQVIKNLDQK